MVRANLSQVVIGNTNRATESRHATGAEAEIPDISEYSRGRKGYFQVWDPQAKEITARGPHVPARGAPGRAGLLQAHRGRPQGHQAHAARRGTRRARPPGARSRSGSAGRKRDAGAGWRRPGSATRAPAARGQPAAAPAPAVQRSRGVPARGDGGADAAAGRAGGHHGAATAGLALGKSKATAHEYLTAAAGPGHRGADRRRPRLAVPAGPANRPQAGAAPSAGSTPAVPDHPGARRGRPRRPGRRRRGEQRAVLEKVWQIAHRPRLTLLQGGGGDATVTGRTSRKIVRQSSGESSRKRPVPA